MGYSSVYEVCNTGSVNGLDHKRAMALQGGLCVGNNNLLVIFAERTHSRLALLLLPTSCLARASPSWGENRNIVRAFRFKYGVCLSVVAVIFF